MAPSPDGRRPLGVVGVGVSERAPSPFPPRPSGARETGSATPAPRPRLQPIPSRTEARTLVFLAWRKYLIIISPESLIHLGTSRTHCSPPPLLFVGCGVARFFFLFFFFNCRFEAAAGELGEELGSRRVTEPTRSPASSLSHPQPAAAADGPDPPHLLSPVFSRPVLAARSQGRRLRGGREPGRRGRKPEPLDCYYWSRGVAVEKHV